MKKGQIIELMLKTPERFKHIQMYEKGKSITKPATKPVTKPKREIVVKTSNPELKKVAENVQKKVNDKTNDMDKRITNVMSKLVSEVKKLNVPDMKDLKKRFKTKEKMMDEVEKIYNEYAKITKAIPADVTKNVKSDSVQKTLSKQTMDILRDFLSLQSSLVKQINNRKRAISKL